jgi:putative acetyltransferase
MMSVSFRVAKPEDAPAVLDLKRAAIRDLAGWHYSAEAVDAWAPSEDALPAFEGAIDSEQFTVLLAEMDGDLAGYGVLNGAGGRIDAAFVHPDYGQQGIATSLVGQLESRAEMRDIEELEIVASLNARSFYENLGYWHFGTQEREIDGVEIEFAVMHKRLNGQVAARD